MTVIPLNADRLELFFLKKEPDKLCLKAHKSVNKYE